MSIEKLKEAVLSFQQWDAGEHTTHFFADGMYCRVLFQPAGCLIVGKIHKKEHFYIVASGEITITGDGEAPRKVIGPAVIVSRPGTQRALYAHTDTTYLTVHRTDKTDLEEVENELVEADPSSPYLPGNRLPLLECK